MIYDTLANAHTYYGLGERFRVAFEYLQNFDPATPDGKVVVDGENVIAIVQSYLPTSAVQRPFESHRKYADIQYVISGEEIIQFATLPSLHETSAYAEANDCALYTGQDDVPLHMLPGFLALLLPQDGHKPGCLWRKPSTVRKIVMKVRV